MHEGCQQGDRLDVSRGARENLIRGYPRVYLQKNEPRVKGKKP